jgi:hypothetical protein
METIPVPGLNEKAILARWYVAPGAHTIGVEVEDRL